LLTRKAKQSPCLFNSFSRTSDNLRCDAPNGDDGPVRYTRHVVSALNVEVAVCSETLVIGS